MTTHSTVSEEAGRVRTITTDDATTVVADLGAAVTGTVELHRDAVVVDSPERRYELDVETTPERANLNNGILTLTYGDRQ